MKRFRFPLSGYGTGSSPNRRVYLAAFVIASLLFGSGLAAQLADRQQQHGTGHTPTRSAGLSPIEAAPTPAAGTADSPPRPPRISDPVAYGKAAAAMLWSYDTRSVSRGRQLAGMHAWMTPEAQYSDWSSIAAQVPDPLLWARMRDQSQHATATITEGHFPSAFKQALADNPSALTQAYIYVVTVTGRQSIAWKDGGAGAEDNAVTLAVQCRPSHDCALVSVAPSVAP